MFARSRVVDGFAGARLPFTTAWSGTHSAVCLGMGAVAEDTKVHPHVG
jgi:hypothetical protein